MLIAFELSMPNINTWNNRWSGEGKYYARVKNFGRTEEKNKIAKKVLEKGSYYYNFGDGWGMSISVREVDSKEAQKIRRKTDGFMGYEWAITSIIEKQKITTE